MPGRGPAASDEPGEERSAHGNCNVRKSISRQAGRQAGSWHHQRQSGPEPTCGEARFDDRMMGKK